MKHTVGRPWIDAIANRIEYINDKALQYAMMEFCDGWVDDDSPEWEEYGDDILACKEEFFEEDFEEWLNAWHNETGISWEDIANHLLQHGDRLVDVLRLEHYKVSIDKWLENLIENHSNFEEAQNA